MLCCVFRAVQDCGYDSSRTTHPLRLPADASFLSVAGTSGPQPAATGVHTGRIAEPCQKADRLSAVPLGGLQGGSPL